MHNLLEKCANVIYAQMRIRIMHVWSIQNNSQTQDDSNVI